MAAPALGFGSICATTRSNSLHFSLSSNPTNLLSFFSPTPRRPSLCATASRPNTAFSTVAKAAESEAPVLEAESPAEVVPAAEPSEAAEPAEPAPKREEIYAVVMVGSRQYIVFPGRWIHTQRLKDANVNDKDFNMYDLRLAKGVTMEYEIILNKVLLVGTKNSTYIGKPVVTNAAVHAVVEQQLLDDKVIVFKYKSKKKYRRNIGHRQPITRIRVTGITGYEDYPAS